MSNFGSILSIFILTYLVTRAPKTNRLFPRFLANQNAGFQFRLDNIGNYACVVQYLRSNRFSPDNVVLKMK